MFLTGLTFFFFFFFSFFLFNLVPANTVNTVRTCRCFWCLPLSVPSRSRGAFDSLLLLVDLVPASTVCLVEKVWLLSGSYLRGSCVKLKYRYTRYFARLLPMCGIRIPITRRHTQLDHPISAKYPKPYLDTYFPTSEVPASVRRNSRAGKKQMR